MTNYFTNEELSCTCCSENKFDQKTLDRLNKFREFCGFPFDVTSGYRCPKYNKLRGFTQTHATGQAVDIALTHKQAYIVVTKAKEFGFTGIGVKQKGAGRFVHLDDLEEASGRPRPHIWSY
ncbi:D-Ala-D-Ala carboxypeptidase family metallohydrolase [Pseudoalteromonas marina]|uniref:D-Ala-D-Ala carboxypeptidase family metallohydrolase n=1 Tax=Pseudoalteromonas marina TaxID=267375 RepID=UPI003C4F7C0E